MSLRIPSKKFTEWLFENKNGTIFFFTEENAKIFKDFIEECIKQTSGKVSHC